MGKRSLRRKNTRGKTHVKRTKSNRRTINKQRTRKMCVHCRCKLCHCSKMHKMRKTRSNKRKIRGGGSLHLDKLVPMDIKNAWRNFEHGFESLGSKIGGTQPPQSPSAVNQSYLLNKHIGIPDRTDIRGSYANASSQVNTTLGSV